MHPQAEEFARLFEGWHKNYGTYRLTGEVDERGKALGEAYSLAGNVTIELWHDHLKGIQGLGVIPITDQSKVKFAAIDIDDYELDIAAVVRQIHEEKFPLVPCRTKSGGLHLYLFLSDWISAKVAQQKLREMAAKLGFGGSEIFPKQHTILAERGDIGQWINMPYFDAAKTQRFGIDEENKPIPVDKFPRYAFARMIDPEQLAATKFSDDLSVSALPEGPPCLNHLASKGFPLGTRNNGLFNMGVYAQKVNPDTWQNLLHDYNKKFMDPPLTPSEVQGVIKSLNKAKGYTYTCKQQPIVNHCNVNKCRACKYGIGVSGVGMPKYGTLCKVDAEPPIWFVDVEGGGRVALSTDELQKVYGYQRRVMDDCNVVPPLVKAEVWSEVISKLMTDVTIIEIPEEATPRGLLRGYLNEFCTSRVQAKSQDEILLGKPFTDRDMGYVYFRMRDFVAFLERMKFRELKLNRIASHLRDWGCEKKFFKIKLNGVNCYAVPIKQLHFDHSEPTVPETIKRTNPF
jgi:hypothetical protein